MCKIAARSNVGRTSVALTTNAIIAMAGVLLIEKLHLVRLEEAAQVALFLCSSLAHWVHSSGLTVRSKVIVSVISLATNACVVFGTVVVLTGEGT